MEADATKRMNQSVNRVLDTLSDEPSVKKLKDLFSKYTIASVSDKGSEKPADRPIPGYTREELERMIYDIHDLYMEYQYDRRDNVDLGFVRELLLHGQINTVVCYVDPATSKREEAIVTTFLVEKDKLDPGTMKDSLEKEVTEHGGGT